MDPPLPVANDLGFRVGFSGHSGHLRVEPVTTVERPNPLRSIPDFVLPPAFPSETPESIKNYIEETYLKPRLDPDEFSPEKAGRQWEFDWFDRAEVPLEPSLPRSVVVPIWEPPFRRSNSELVKGRWEPKFEEVDVSDLTSGAVESGPLPRTSAKDFVRGSINNRPFRPGGLDDSQAMERILPEGASNGEWVHEILSGGSAQTIPPSLKHGVDLGALKPYPYSWTVYEDTKSIKSLSVEKLRGLSVQFDDLFKKAWEADVVEEQEEDPTKEQEDGHLSESETVTLEIEAGTAEEFSQAHDNEISLDDILSADSVESKLHLDGFGNEVGQQKAWAMHEASGRIAERFYELVPDMALEFPFELDSFQKEAIYYLEKGESVFVAAHTSAGKTVVAEYAFALASKHCTRAVYTAPIKTISNQKYRDFCGKFDVGLLTGDVSLRPEASCLIMTTEILRSMLYRGADIIRDIEWVIFDEVHYVNDVERGVVWEEVIIMLPRHINIILLSATVPNTVEFADWIGRTKQKEIRVTGTTKRPVPLEHCLFYSGELYKICENETFLPQGLKAAKDVSKKKNLTAGGSGPKTGTSAGRDNARVQKRDNMSRGKQHGNNFSGTGRGYQNNGNGQNNWELRRADASMWLMLINKLSKKSLLPVLFSTETFAMGVNAPARTVVFDGLRKFDGKEFRQLLPGEYTQMAGRAGRRGLDKIGTVILMCRDELPEERDLKHVTVGSATRLESQFRLTYIMILHLLRVEELKVEDMLKRSFAEFHAQKKLPEMQQLLKLKLNQPTKAIECIKGEPTIEEYYDLYTEAETYSNQISEAIMQSPNTQQFLTTGRVVVVKSESAQDHLLGVVVKTPSQTNKLYIVLVIKPDMPSSVENASGGGSQNQSNAFDQGYFVIPKSRRGMGDEYITSVSARKGRGVINIKLPYLGSASGMGYEVREVDSKEFLCICSSKIKIDQVGLLEDVSNSVYAKTVQLLLELKSDGNKYPPALDPVKDLKLRDVLLVQTYHKWTKLLEKMSQNPCHGCIKLEEHLKLAKEMKKHKEEVHDLQFQISDDALQQMPDFQGRIDVLKKIGCIDEDLVVQMKGRVACEMNSGEELICTECLFENQLDDLEPEEAVALMSAFVFQQKNTSDPSLTPTLAKARQRLYNTAIRLGELQAHFHLPINPEEYAQENLKFGLVEVVYEWAKGTPFADICELTDVPEGLIVRTIVRLDETCREFKNSAAIMGNSALCKKMEIASNAIKRDIVFAASLYITGV
ncbi:DExH-box ATP-dependent RNA helicase DExH11 isoform X3 [Arachis ipaensis]|uniref:DExH-box ATP-dependent RNA helicase DExH11 isoform X3 n=1 Tax=Arachis ipaensis TaxID=130454 RepID=UPI000A2B6A71|nr:DExH-box ATP-dependent RNA helicase DExH11 isoform X3 [Arachis ipaensis]